MLRMACPRCGAETPEEARFCPACGADLGTVAALEERKLVSILFVDVVGSTAHADGADPEDVRDRNQLYYEAVRERIERHGGVVEKYVGDAVMAVFGAPLSHSDDAERAVRAAVSILESVKELNARDPELDLEIRAAVCTGDAVVVVDPAPGEAIATGDVVNTAARLQSAAPPGRAIVGGETQRLTRHAFRFEELPPIDAKGKEHPVPAWLVGEPLAAAADRPASRTPLIGRDRELTLIRMMWDRAVSANRPHLISVLGPAGIGKSRLAQEVTADIERQGGRALWGRSLPYEEQTPYRAFGEILRRAAGIFENDPVEVARDKLAAHVSSVFPSAEATEATRYLSLLLGLGLDEPATEAIHLLFATRRLVEHLAEREPLVLVFEDLHWADDALLDLIDYLVSHVSDRRVLFLALARPEFLETRPTWGTGMAGQTTLPLEPLTPDEATEVVASLIAEAVPSTVAKVVATAEGNPLFIEELVASLADETATGELPATVRAAISARIDALPSVARTTMLRASVIGSTFWRGVLEGIGDADDVGASLQALEARGLIQRRSQSRVEGDVEFAFKHALIRDTAYGTLPRATRRELHASTARVIEASAHDPAELAWILAHHWREAGEPARAAEYLLGAADRARDALAVEETYDLYTRALDLAQTDDDRRRIRLRRALALTELEDYARADRELADLIPELDGVDEIEALLARARSTLWTEQTDETMALAERTVELVATRGPAELEPVALSLLSQAHGMRGDEGDLERAKELGDRALATWPSGKRPNELAQHYHLHADVEYWAGDYERTMELSRLASELGGSEPHGAEMLLRGAGMQGLAFAGMGRYEEALAIGDAAIATARTMGRPANVVTNYSTAPLRDIFSLEEARRRSQEVVDRLGPSDFNMPWMNARADLIGAELLQGDLGSVERSLPGAWDDALGSKAWEHWLISGRLCAARAEVELLRGRYDEAVTWSRRAIELARGGGRRKYQTIALTTLGRALSSQKLADEAVRELRTARDLADELGTPLLRWQTRAALAEAEGRSRGAAGDPENHRREAAEIIRGVAASLAPERAAAYLAAPQVADVLG
jgi:class 3 adenylate cyclase/tetratricopeptide (TPR) repeat protein